MLQRLKDIFATPSTLPLESAAPLDMEAAPVHIAAAALLVHAAGIDGTIEEREADLLARITSRHFGLSAAEATFLLEQAHLAADEANDLYRFTSQINANFSPAHKLNLIELVWQIVLADAIIDDYEANLLRRLAGLLYVSDKDVGAAKHRAQQKLDLKED
ncbi:MAG: TerB family tellurite resistance protein [Alphaproteobacteria bacterium]|nr:TerB family tellurite resistance protein [Alphaproteobacteria bacterium]MBE8220054.1 TerB family tellurite resistance protein [Alphaproteobacteria bacterium]